MAGILARTPLAVSKLSQRTALVVLSTRGKKTYTPDPMEHATGIERRELEAIARGNPDPFNTRVRTRGPGTKDNPNLVPSFNDQRLIGCICHEDAFYVSYMWVHMGEPKRCRCGHWFKLTEAEDPFKDLPNFHQDADVLAEPSSN